jgi:hypothetical protein
MIPAPLHRYEVFIYNHDGSVLMVLQSWDRLEITQRLSAAWNYSIQLRVRWEDDFGEDLRTLPRDALVQIYRYDRFDYGSRLAFEGMHSTVTEQVQTSGDIFFNLYGVGYTKLLDRRVVVPDSDSEFLELTGNAETVAKTFVVDQFINPEDTDRRMPGFVNNGDQGRGDYAEYKARHTNVLSVIQNVCDAGKLYFGIEGGQELGTFIFDTRPIWGEDKRVGVSDDPVIFSVDLGNMFIPILSTNRRHEKNVVYVGGIGRGVDQLIREVKNQDSIEASPWSRSEVWVVDNNLDANAELDVLGRRELQERGARQEFTFDIREISGSRWLADWGVGDRVTAYYKGRTFDKVFTKITVTVTSGSAAQYAESLEVEMEDVWYG